MYTREEEDKYWRNAGKKARTKKEKEWRRAIEKNDLFNLRVAISRLGYTYGLKPKVFPWQK